MKEGESFLNIKEFACCHGVYPLADGNDCSVPSQSPISSSRKWDKTSLCSHCCLPSLTQYASPHAFTFSRGSVQPDTSLTHSDGAQALETEQVEGPAVLGPLLALSQVVPSLNLRFPRGFTEPGLGRRWPRPTSTRLSPVRNDILAYSFIQQTLTEHPHMPCTVLGTEDTTAGKSGQTLSFCHPGRLPTPLPGVPVTMWSQSLRTSWLPSSASSVALRSSLPQTWKSLQYPSPALFSPSWR